MIKAKIQQHNGASISFALAFFLVAAMVCSTIVAASVTAVKRTNDEKERQQAQLTLESCAKMLEKGLENTKIYVVSEQVTDDSGNVVALNYQLSKVEGDLGGMVSAALTNVITRKQQYHDETLRIELSGTTEAAGTAAQSLLLGAEKIEMSYTMPMESDSGSVSNLSLSKRFDMTILLTLAVPRGEGATKKYQMSIRADADVIPSEDQDPESVPDGTPFKIIWNDFKYGMF